VKKYHSFYSDLYFQNFYFFCGHKRSDMEKAFNISLPPECLGMTLETQNGIVIWVHSNEAVGALVHECVHAAKILFAQKGIKASNKNDEPMSYTTQWIFENCYKKMKRSTSRF